MKTPNTGIKEAADVCHGSRIYPLLTRYEKKRAVIYCLKLMVKNQVKH
ncbi:MAG: hypothetical protein M1508_09725 [Nitrospirae bacterium]|nr:hypothetical protein [Nitrospirota bacterium]MCL5422199.1 hypothetical protein [Nitrospirota bacterium]